MSIQTIFGNVQFSADKPFRERRRPVENSLPRPLPSEFFRLACPKFRGTLDRLAIHPAILPEGVDPGLRSKFLRWLKHAALGQKRFDVRVVHGRFLISPRELSSKH